MKLKNETLIKSGIWGKPQVIGWCSMPSCHLSPTSIGICHVIWDTSCATEVLSGWTFGRFLKFCYSWSFCMCGGCIWAGAVLLLHQAYGKASISYFIGMCSPVTFQHGNDGKRCPFAVKCAWKKNAYTFSPGSDWSVDWIMISGAGHDVGIQVILGEEVATSKMTLFDVTKQICDAIQARGEQGTMKPPSFVTLLSCCACWASQTLAWYILSFFLSSRDMIWCLEYLCSYWR